MEFPCDGTVSDENPSVCTNQFLSAMLNAGGYPARYTVGDLPS